MNQLSFWDYAVMGAYMIGVLALGLFFSGRQKSLREYFLASGSLPWWAISISLYATMLSPLSFLGICGWVFMKDSRWAVGAAVVGIGTTILAAVIWVPLWGRLQMMSIYEYLEKRFHPGLRAFGAALFPISMLFWVGNGLVAAAMAFKAVTGVPLEYCVIGTVLLGTVYTMLGGSRAVIWTDVAQAAVFFFAFVVIDVLLLQYFGWQPTKIYNIASSVISEETGYPKTKMFSAEFSLAVEATIWAIIFSNIIDALMFGSSQVRVQRLLAAGSRRNMYKSLFGYIGVSSLFIGLTVSAAWGFVAYYEQNTAAKAMIDHPDQVMPNYVASQVPVFVRGLIMAGLLAAVMSTFDSALISMSSITVNDFYRRYLVRQRSEKHYVSSSRLITFAWGAVVLAFALWQLGHRDSPVLERVGKLNLLVLPPMGTFFVLGVFTKRCNTMGVLIGALASVAMALAFSGFPGLMKPWVDPRDFAINWIWLNGLCTATGFLMGYLASLLFRPPAADKLQGLTMWTKLD
jgi:SSS family solute:Na+ symporter